MHRKETMTMKVKTNSDTLAHPELGAVGDLVVVLEVGNAVKGSTGMVAILVDEVVVVATEGVGPGVISMGDGITEEQQYDSSTSPINRQ